ncbi:hypothetical protein OR16_37225 [Cupriavidus basilensis OR16]|uniref:Uncharacterized protein n=1 Tax=Cupriavidus basilensis OR16 TaxID=1127483 RepID=H1SGD0_9BURK|nr:hypothetical protein [Cupriavidus basilensis]EHP38468.1 hypothetical protein OR16_37225 [Cupriavidus basilensis OR16]
MTWAPRAACSAALNGALNGARKAANAWPCACRARCPRPPLRGALWESGTIIDVRNQAAALAARLVEELGLAAEAQAA